VPTGQELINRGNNLFLIGFIAVAGVAGIPLIQVEGGVKGGFDEAGILLVGLAAAAWYWRSRYSRSLVPLAFLSADMVLKIVALVIEDPDDRGDDVGTMITFILLVVAWSVVYLRTRPAAINSAEVVGQPGHPVT
jgi:hypothetical protein